MSPRWGTWRCRTWLTRDDRCTGRVGVIGFSLGGGFALRAASRLPFAVASVNYGEVPDVAAGIIGGACPVIASYGGRDRTTRGHPERLEEALAAAGVDHDVTTYSPAGHSFHSTQPYPRGVAVLAKVMGMDTAGEASDRDDGRRAGAEQRRVGRSQLVQQRQDQVGAVVRGIGEHHRVTGCVGPPTHPECELDVQRP